MVICSHYLYCQAVHFFSLCIVRLFTSFLSVLSGCWAPYIVESLGVKLPQYSIRHAYVVTERMEEVIGMPSIRDHDLSIYLKVQGDVLQIGGYEPNPVFIDDGVSRTIPEFSPFFCVFILWW